MLLDRLKQFLYGKIRVDEINSPIFQKPEDRQYIFEQYALGMEFFPIGGWHYIPNQSFSSNRKIESDGFQHFGSLEKGHIGFFSGSTGWGWGLTHEEYTLHYKLSEVLGKKVTNYSQVAYTLAKILFQMKWLKSENKLQQECIVYFGVNEAFSISGNESVYVNQRDKRVMKNLANFQQAYYGIPTGIVGGVKSAMQRVIYTAKTLGVLPPKKKKGMIAPAKINYELHIQQVLDIIMEINSLCSVTFVLEPTVFHKCNPTPFELGVIEKYRDSSFEKVVHDLYRKIEVHCETHRVDLISAYKSIADMKDEGFWDYCHPSDKVTTEVVSFINSKFVR